MTGEQPDDGGSAFPAMLPGGYYCTPGMSLRDWFAGQALVGWLAGCPGNAEIDSVIIRRSAFDAYRIADAILAARDVSK